MVPETTLSDAIPLAARIAREFGGTVSRQGLARALGMSDRGGRFAARIGALRLWGLAEGRDQLRLTRDGVRAASPVSREESAAARRALAMSVPLLAELAARAPELPLDRARAALLVEEITGASRVDVARRLARLLKILDDAAADLATGPGARGARSRTAPAASGSAGNRQAEPEAPAAPEHTRGCTEPAMLELRFPAGTVRIPETPENLEAVIQILRARREALREARGSRPGGPGPPNGEVTDTL